MAIVKRAGTKFRKKELKRQQFTFLMINFLENTSSGVWEMTFTHHAQMIQIGLAELNIYTCCAFNFVWFFTILVYFLSEIRPTVVLTLKRKCTFG